MNSDFCAGLRSFHKSLSQPSSLLQRQRNFEAYREASGYREVLFLSEESFCSHLCAEISAIRVHAGVVEGRATCGLFTPSSICIPVSNVNRTRRNLVEKAKLIYGQSLIDPVFVGFDSSQFAKNKRLAILCYRLPTAELFANSFVHFLSHPIFGTRDRSARVNLDLSGGTILWITISWTPTKPPRLPVGADLLKLVQRPEAPKPPKDYQLSPGSPQNEEPLEKALERITLDLDLLTADLKLKQAAINIFAQIRE